MKRVSEYFGELTFNRTAMRQYLNKEVYHQLLDTIEQEKPLAEEIAPAVAHAMKEWAIKKGATHFTHWFQPRRSGTAEKHDSFISYDEYGNIIERFSSKQLIQSEPDASSFPSGGVRSTFEARGYTAWDPGSPAFLVQAGNASTLVIPSVFLSFTGDVLDQKTPMLRAQRALNRSCLRLQKRLGNRFARQVRTWVGIEQEYFLLHRHLARQRPDLRVCGRTLFGAPPLKGQEMEDHYLGTMKDRVVRYMEELAEELYKRGIPAKTRHNEVAPNQFELACLYEEARLAVDHNLQLMDIMKRVAIRHDLKVLLDEKPFDGINGSGKHFNWSLGDNTGTRYLRPSRSPLNNLNFLMTIAALLFGVNRHGGLLRAAVAGASNDYRLGGFEAPPAIISVYLGEYLTSILNEIEGIGRVTDKNMAEINLGIRNLPRVARDVSDRNRTSPIAFTGDKFEFRAVGASMNCAEIATVINTLVSFGFDEIYSRLERKRGDVKKNAILVIREMVRETKRIRFEGNSYSPEWDTQARERGLPLIQDTPSALKEYSSREVIDLFTQRKVYSRRELEASIEVKLNEYVKVKDIQFKTAIHMTRSHFLPAIHRYLGEIARTCGRLGETGIQAPSLQEDVQILNNLYQSIRDRCRQLEKVEKKGILLTDLEQKARMYAGPGEGLLGKLRKLVDEAETLVAEDLWPIPTYQELLIKL